MTQDTKEKVSVVVGLVLLSALNGAGATRVIYKLLGDHFKKREKEKKIKFMSEESFRVMLSRLKKQGIVESGGRGIWRLTSKGHAQVRSGEEKRKAYEQTRIKSQTKKDTIIIFDVPELRRTLRDYLRAELVALGYEQLQKSVWIGGGPLPEAFMGFVREKKLTDTMHIFTIEKKGTVEK
ncbi:MAG: hypothetical protein Q7R63_02040 [bacterium]|nr:hypothetical protein [bacterium]